MRKRERSPMKWLEISVYPTDNVVSLKGWGGSDRGHFLPGTYRYEVWYNDMCFKAVTFKLK